MVEVNEPGFVLTEFPQAQVLPENLYRQFYVMIN